MKKCDVASHPIVRCSLPQFHTGPHHGSVSWTTHDTKGFFTRTDRELGIK